MDTIRTLSLTVRLMSDRGRLHLFYEVSDGIGMTSLGPFDSAVRELARQIRTCLPKDDLEVPEMEPGWEDRCVERAKREGVLP